MQNLIGDTTMGLLSRSLDAAFTRQEVIANNIANHNTPGFKKSRVAFEEYLQQALGGDGKKLPLWKTNPRHFGAYDSIDAVKAENKKITQGSMRVDGNNVDLEEEMTNLAMNGINYNFATRMLNNKISNIRHVVSEGRR